LCFQQKPALCLRKNRSDSWSWYTLKWNLHFSSHQRGKDVDVCRCFLPSPLLPCSWKTRPRLQIIVCTITGWWGQR
jgi:hypothetical protein